MLLVCWGTEDGQLRQCHQNTQLSHVVIMRGDWRLTGAVTYFIISFRFGPWWWPITLLVCLPLAGFGKRNLDSCSHCCGGEFNMKGVGMMVYYVLLYLGMKRCWVTGACSDSWYDRLRQWALVMQCYVPIYVKFSWTTHKQSNRTWFYMHLQLPCYSVLGGLVPSSRHTSYSDTYVSEWSWRV